MAQESWKLDQEETGCQTPEGPIFCANNCGFFGSKATMNMCSKCYRDVVMAQAMATAAKATADRKVLATLISAPLEKPEPVLTQLEGKPFDTAAVVEGNVSGPSQNLKEPSPSRPVNRCFLCNKRVGLTGFKCRCGDIFCSLHRYSDKHGCSFDYKSAGRDAILKENPLVKAEKIEKI